MKARDALIAWTPPSHKESPTAGQVRVGALIDRASAKDWAAVYDCTGGAAHMERRTLDDTTSTLMVFVDFHTLVVGDGMDPKVVHEAFLAIDEFAEHISPDIQGARHSEDDT